MKSVNIEWLILKVNETMVYDLKWFMFMKDDGDSRWKNDG